MSAPESINQEVFPFLVFKLTKLLRFLVQIVKTFNDSVLEFPRPATGG